MEARIKSMGEAINKDVQKFIEIQRGIYPNKKANEQFIRRANLRKRESIDACERSDEVKCREEIKKFTVNVCK